MAEPLRLVVDIQVLLSGVTHRHGPSHDLWQAARRFEVVLILGEQHFAELVRVLTYPQVLALGAGALTPSVSFQFATQLFQIGEYYASVVAHDWPSCPDPKDWYLLDLLMSSGADALISKDNHLLKLRDKLGLPVFEPKVLGRWGLLSGPQGAAQLHREPPMLKKTTPPSPSALPSSARTCPPLTSPGESPANGCGRRTTPAADAAPGKNSGR